MLVEARIEEGVIEKGIKWGCERMGSSFGWLWEILYRWLDLAASHICSSAVLLGMIWEDER